MNKRLVTELDDAWLGLRFNEEYLIRPLDVVFDDDPISYIKKMVWLMTQPEYFSFVCKYVLGVELLPFQCVVLAEMWNRKFPMFIATRGAGKSFLLALYAVLRALILPNRKIIVVGAAFRQSKVIYEYAENIWNNAPVLQSLCDQGSGPRRDVDMCRLKINNSMVTALPIGNGEKIRGQRAQDICTDEMASVPIDIFENVIAGFASVRASPAESVKLTAMEKNSKKYDIVIPHGYGRKEDEYNVDNQIIISGTAYYDFNHFANYWRKWKQIVESKGDERKLEELFNGEVPPNFSWSDYSVVRLPYEVLPDGFMDEGQIARSKATIHSGIFQMEFQAVFCSDSQGFFKRSLIESCVPKNNEPVELASGEVSFNPTLKGNPALKHIIAVDPASEQDNFCVIVLEIREDHRRIVHCWTTTRKSFHEKRKAENLSETDFYSFCARKIRNLAKTFPTDCIAIDSQGGIAVIEALHDSDKIKEGELPFWPRINPEKELPTDGESGLHNIEVCNFADYKWLHEANHGLRKDMEDKVLLFPMFDPVTIGLSIEEDKMLNRRYDTLEDCVMEIEELKNELSIIEMTVSPNGREKWDTPEIKTGIGKKGRLRKDRYSALIMANMSARVIDRTPEREEYNSIGGFAHGIPSKNDSGKDFEGPAWFSESMQNIY